MCNCVPDEQQLCVLVYIYGAQDQQLLQERLVVATDVLTLPPRYSHHHPTTSHHRLSCRLTPTQRVC